MHDENHTTREQNQNTTRPDTGTEPAGPLLPGDRVTDGDADRADQSAARVVERTGKTTAETQIPGGKTVADVNPDYPPTSRVATVAFENGLERHVDGWDDLEPEDLQARVSSATLTTYSYPVERLERINEAWEPVGGGSKSSARQTRDELAAEHPAAFDAFEIVLRTILADPTLERSRIGNRVRPYMHPETREGCINAREDELTNDPDILVCWECSTHDRLPNKYRKSDRVPKSEPCETRDPAATVAGLTEWLTEDVDGIDASACAPDEDYSPHSLVSYDLRDLENEKNRVRRKASVKIAYKATLAGHFDGTYNFSRALAFLRDRGVDTDALLPGGDPY